MARQLTRCTGAVDFTRTVRPRSAAPLDESDVASRKARLLCQKGNPLSRREGRLSRERYQSVAVVGRRTPAPETYAFAARSWIAGGGSDSLTSPSLRQAGELSPLPTNATNCSRPIPRSRNSKNGSRSNCSTSNFVDRVRDSRPD